MKMPTHPWYPPMEPLKDIFGLHHVTRALSNVSAALPE
jgi:hypothetical protein